jgi:hypothetical protein
MANKHYKIVKNGVIHVLLFEDCFLRTQSSGILLGRYATRMID